LKFISDSKAFIMFAYIAFIILTSLWAVVSAAPAPMLDSAATVAAAAPVLSSAATSTPFMVTITPNTGMAPD
jgi:hypothetical protein